MSLPPLPEPKHIFESNEAGEIPRFTNSEMRAYGAACRAQALEEAAKLGVEYPGRGESDYARGWNDATEGFATAIRAMKDKP